MKTALCLAGLVGTAKSKNRHGKSEKSVLDIGYEHYRKHILNKNDVDVFIHCWDVHFETEVTGLYKPKESQFEEPKQFTAPRYIRDDRFNDSYSRWYGIKRSIEIKRQYEEDNGFQYDCVMLGRFDVAWQTDVVFSRFDMKNLHVGHWCEMFHGKKMVLKGGRGVLYDWISQGKKIPKLTHAHKGFPNKDGKGLIDFWFFSNSEAMDKFGTCFDKLDKYYLPRWGKKLFGKYPVEFPATHIIVGHHIQETGLLKNLKFVFHLYDDFPLVRRRFLDCRL